MPPGCQRPRALTAEREAGGMEIESAVSRAKQGDSDAMRFLYERYAARVYGHARAIVRNAHDAEDITQLVFTRLLTAIGGYEQRSVPFSAWLLRITQNAAIDHLRRTSPVMLDPELPRAGSADNVDNSPREDLVRALSELPRVQREVVLLRHLGGYSPGEIAERLGRSEDSIHGLHHRGRRALRHALSANHLRPATLAA